MPLDLYPPIQRDPFVNPEDAAMQEIERDSPHLTEPAAPGYDTPTLPAMVENPVAPLVNLAGPTTESTANTNLPLAGRPLQNQAPTTTMESASPAYQAPEPAVTQPVAGTVPPFMMAPSPQPTAESAQPMSAPTAPEAPVNPNTLQAQTQSLLNMYHQQTSPDFQTQAQPTTEQAPAPVAQSSILETKQLAEEMSRREENWSKIMANRTNVGNRGNQFEEIIIP